MLSPWFSRFSTYTGNAGTCDVKHYSAREPWSQKSQIEAVFYSTHTSLLGIHYVAAVLQMLRIQQGTGSTPAQPFVGWRGTLRPAPTHTWLLISSSSR